MAEYNCSRPTSHGHLYLFTVIDCPTRCLEAIGMKTARSVFCTSALLSEYNPAAKGMVERLHHNLKVALKSRCKDSNRFTQLPFVILELRTTPNNALDLSSAEMLYDDLVVVPADFFQPATSSDNLQCLCHIVGKWLHAARITNPGKQHIPIDLFKTWQVFLCSNTSKPPLTPPHTGPFLVIRGTKKTFLLNVRGKEDWVFIDRLQTVYLLQKDLLAVRFSNHLSIPVCTLITGFGTTYIHTQAALK
ncbi:uncharacterized protein [Palaemon carinicauda]|uniref:uncharacterized protein n=1 Tax=Palaemon carinicauda TaxID=392227 RepID=UPI0035B64C69